MIWISSQTLSDAFSPSYGVIERGLRSGATHDPFTPMPELRPFHLAFPVNDLEAARHFYGTVLRCPQGREATGVWIDYDLFGHQIVAHYDPALERPVRARNAVDGDAVPVPHFGVVLTLAQFDELAERLQADDATRWVIEPRTRFAGESGEQRTMFFLDPAGNALEFKAFANDADLFAT